MSVTDEIKSRIDIVHYIQRHVPALKKAGRNYKACCPFHNEKTPSFVVNPERQSWRCFGACAEGGDLFTFAQKVNGWDFKEALRELGQEAGVQLEAQTPEQKTRSDRMDKLRGLLADAAAFYQRQLRREAGAFAYNYLTADRGIGAETAELFQLGYAPDSWDFMLRSLRSLGHSDEDIVETGLAVRHDSGRVYDRFRQRLMFPIRDERGRTVGFGGRALNPDDNAKYINSPQSPLFDKSRLLYGLDMGRRSIRETGAAVIVEGYMDVIQAYQAGYHNVVAQMGTAMTEAQVRLVAPRYAKRIVLALDADEAGQSAARRSLEVAREILTRDYAGRLSTDLRVLKIAGGKDPDDVLRENPERWPALVDDAQAVADFVIDRETAALPANASLQERQAAAQAVLPLLHVSENNLYRQENIQKLARRLRIGERDMLAWAQAQRPPPPQAAPPARQGAATADLPPEYWDNEDADIPPDEWGDDSAPTTPRTREPLKRAAEAYCLGMLLKNPHLLALVNRKLRELAGDDDELLRGPLRELCAEDFSQIHYRALMTHLQDSMAQDDMEPVQYLYRVIETELAAEFEALLVDEPEAVSQTMKRNFQVDFDDIWRGSQHRSRPGFSLRDELITQALQLRLARLEHERVELQYLQEETQTGAESDPGHSDQLNASIMLSMRAKARINLAVG